MTNKSKTDRSKRRKPAATPRPWNTTPAFEEAYDRLVRTSEICAAVLWGGEASDDPGSPQEMLALVTSKAMQYFLMRMDPRDVKALYDGPGTFADLAYKPFPRDFKPHGAAFRRLMPQVYEYFVDA